MKKRRFRRKKPIARHEFGGFVLEIYYDEGDISGCYVSVSSVSGIYSLRVGLGNGGYGYVVKCAELGDWESIESWVCCNYGVSSFLGASEVFAKDVIGALGSEMTRMELASATSALAVTESEDKIAEADMEDTVKYSEMSDSEREERKEYMREEFKKLLGEMD